MSVAANKVIPVILCGGAGSRLWPLSREQYPKQLLRLTGEQTLLQSTVRRLDAVLESLQDDDQAAVGEQVSAQVNDPFIVTNEAYCYIVAEQLRQIHVDAPHIILEPCGRNTAPAVTVAALHAVDPNAILLVMPSDHLIKDRVAFQRAIAKGVTLARQDKMVTFGIVPSEAHTGFGYIRQGKALGEEMYQIDSFVEKPELARAQEYVASGQYLWNSGIFMLRAGLWLQQIRSRRAEIFKCCQRALDLGKKNSEFIRLNADAFAESPSDSIDYAVAEHLPPEMGAVVALDAGWSDLGAWDALYQMEDKDAAGNVLQGDVIVEGSENCYVRAENKLVACLGLQDTVVVETDDAVLISSFDRLQDIKHIVQHLKAGKRSEAVSRAQVFRPWGSYESISCGPRFQVKRIIVNPGAALSLQMHYHRAEHWVVVVGTAKVTRGEDEILLSENQSIYIPLGTKHRLENPGLIPLEIIEVQSGSYLDENDIVRFEDCYGRA